MQFQVRAELQPAVAVRDGKDTFNIIGNRLAGRVRQIVDRKRDDVVANPDPPVFTAVAHETRRAAGAR